MDVTTQIGRIISCGAVLLHGCGLFLVVALCETENLVREMSGGLATVGVCMSEMSVVLCFAAQLASGGSWLVKWRGPPACKPCEAYTLRRGALGSGRLRWIGGDM